MAWTRINLLRALIFRIHRNALQRIYFAFIRPLLKNSDVIWDSCSNECKTQLESIHNEAARIVSDATKLCSIQKLLELGWETLQERRSKHKLVIFYKILNGLTPEYLFDLMPSLVSDINPYNLRNSDNVQSIRARTNIFFNSFFPSTIRAWNNLSEGIRNALQILLIPSNLASIETNKCPQSTLTLDRELDKFFMPAYAWNVAC